MISESNSKKTYDKIPITSDGWLTKFSDVLNITASPNNGTAGSLDHILQNPKSGREPLTVIDFKDPVWHFPSADDYTQYVTQQTCLSCSDNGNPEVYICFLLDTLS